MEQEILRRFPFGMTEHDLENLAVICMSDPMMQSETHAIRIALEDKANSSGTPEQVGIWRKAARKAMREQAQS